MDHVGTKTGLQSIQNRTDAQTGNLTAKALGYNCWTADPGITQAARTSNLQGVYLTALFPCAAVANGGTINLEYYVITAGATLMYGRLGVYSSNGTTGTLIGTSADLSTAATTAGLKTASVTLNQAINPGDFLYIACLFTGTTAPALAAALTTYGIGRGVFYRTALLSSQNTLPSSITLSGTTTSPNLFFFAF